MKSPDTNPREESRPGSFSVSRIIDAILVAGVVIIPLLIQVGGDDVFRAPKEFAIRGLAILLAAASVLALIWQDRSSIDSLKSQRIPLAVIAAIVAWTSITAMFALNRPVAIAALGSVATMAMIAVAALAVFQRLSLIGAIVFLIPAVANSLVFIPQRLKLWAVLPFTVSLSGDTTSTGFLGNIDYVGSYLPAPLLVAIALALTIKRGRVLAWIAAVIIAAAILLSSITGIIAATVGVGVLLFLKTPRYAIVGTGLLLIVAGFVFSMNVHLRSRAATLIEALSSREYDVVFSSRLTAFIAAGRMAREHPLMGVGPGGYAPNYYRYKLEAEQRHPQLLTAYSRTFNFGETHNDHLQTLAETGIPGYALLLAALLLTARSSFTRRETDDRREMSRLLGLPLAATFATLALAQFPLHLPESRLTYVALAALCVVWAAPEVEE